MFFGAATILLLVSLTNKVTEIKFLMVIRTGERIVPSGRRYLTTGPASSLKEDDALFRRLDTLSGRCDNRARTYRPLQETILDFPLGERRYSTFLSGRRYLTTGPASSLEEDDALLRRLVAP